MSRWELTHCNNYSNSWNVGTYLESKVVIFKDKTLSHIQNKYNPHVDFDERNKFKIFKIMPKSLIFSEW